MTRYVAFLRGVNVGAHNRVKMDDLKKLFTSLKLSDPQTYVRTFESSPSPKAMDYSLRIGSLKGQ